MLKCPVCSKPLFYEKNSYKCIHSHSFDVSKEGYVNFLTGKHKDGRFTGDNRDMAKARRNFLEKGCYDFLAQAVAEKIQAAGKSRLSTVDISCGEGYYTNYIKSHTDANICGFDISKEMIRLAAKKYKDIFFFVANIAGIPIADNSMDAAVQICAPFNEKEFARILKDDGILLSVVPAENHLWGLKKLIYDTPYKNNEDIKDYESFTLLSSDVVKSEATFRSREDMMNLFAMTPYFYKTGEKDKQKLMNAETLTTEFEFIIRTFAKRH